MTEVTAIPNATKAMTWTRAKVLNVLWSGWAASVFVVLLATIAIESDIELWTYDSHFALIQAVLPALRLFQEPP